MLLVRWNVLALLVSIFLSLPLQAEDCARSSAIEHPASITLRVDNDALGGAGQDQGYTNGFMLTAMSPNLRDFTRDACLPTLAHYLNRYLSRLQPQGFDQANMVVSLAHALFTPEDKQATHLLENDRPYAAALLFGLGYNARSGNQLRATQLRLGWIGPAALGEEIQNGIHQVIGANRLHGWDNQLHNEPVILLQHERMYRFTLDEVVPDSWLGQDMILHWGGALGNFATYLNLGAEWRLGWKLPNDFGSTPLRLAGDNTAPPLQIFSQGWTGHLFITAGAHWILRDITLDGNTFRDSHHVDKRPLTAYIGGGLAVTYGPWKLAMASYWHTREFDGQKESPVFGSVTFSRRF